MNCEVPQSTIFGDVLPFRLLEIYRRFEQRIACKVKIEFTVLNIFGLHQAWHSMGGWFYLPPAYCLFLSTTMKIGAIRFSEISIGFHRI
jgi:hypothetical protein